MRRQSDRFYPRRFFLQLTFELMLTYLRKLGEPFRYHRLSLVEALRNIYIVTLKGQGQGEMATEPVMLQSYYILKS